jgi:folate-binding protein YgfZ
MLDNAMILLQNQGLLRVIGNKASAFLQGQLSGDLNQVNQQQSRLAAMCNAKGRVLYTLRILADGPDYLLIMPRALVKSAIQDLQKYALLARVHLTDASDDYSLLGIIGDQAITGVLTQVALPISSTCDAVSRNQDLCLLTIPGIKPRLLMLGKPARIQALIAHTGQEDLWHYHDILAGIPEIDHNTQGLFTPHDINYPAINGVSFSKGCYTGQEIVARMHYLGKLKRHMYHLQIVTQKILQPGSFIVDEQGQAIGQIVNLAVNPKLANTYEMLVVMTDSIAEQYLSSTPMQGQPIKILSLPYAIKD